MLSSFKAKIRKRAQVTKRKKVQTSNAYTLYFFSERFLNSHKTHLVILAKISQHNMFVQIVSESLAYFWQVRQPPLHYQNFCTAYEYSFFS